MADEPLNILPESTPHPAGSDAGREEVARAEGVSHPHIDAHADANADVNADADSDFDAERDRLDWLENQPPATSAQRVHRATFLLTITVAALALCVVVVAVVWHLLR